MVRTFLIATSVVIFGFASVVYGVTNLIGYSGAPGSNGACAASCHSHPGGTIQISGFPEEYTPGETYEITLSHSGVLSIRQFNGSCRAGNGSQNAGIITAGTYTATYNTPHETNGVRFSSSSRDSGTFNWTAPGGDASEVKLYIAGLQGGYMGLNSTIVLVSQRSTTGIENEISNMPDNFDLYQNYPNPFNASTAIEFSITEPQDVRLTIFDLLGRQIQTLIDEYRQAGSHSVILDASHLTSGIYFCHLQAGDFTELRKMTLIR